MENYKLSPEALVMTSGSSKGTQKKYYENGYWYKQDKMGYEGMAEYMVSKLLSYSNLSNFVKYEKCTINGKSGCKSKNFLKSGESLLSFERLHTLETGLLLNDVIKTMSSVDDRIFYVLDFLKDTLNYDASVYLGNILTLDALILNQDRHFNNLAVIITSTGEVRECPIFDNGDSLMSSYNKFPLYDEFEKNLQRCVSMPFSANALAQSKILPNSLKLDYQKIDNWLEGEESTRAINVLKHQIEVYKNIIPNINLNRSQTMQPPKHENDISL